MASGNVATERCWGAVLAHAAEPGFPGWGNSLCGRQGGVEHPQTKQKAEAGQKSSSRGKQSRAHKTPQKTDSTP